ncbi:MAG: tetratricopeptide repeat protein [Acidobacteriaceae bacterium]
MAAGLFLIQLSFAQAPAAAGRPSLAAQIVQQEQRLAEARTAQDKKAEATELNTLASLYRQTGERQKAVDYCNEALGLEQGNPLGEATTKNILGRVLTDMGQEQKALDIFSEVLPVWRNAGNRLAEGTTLSNMGRVYNNLGQRDEALKVLNEALPILRAANGRNAEASTLDSIGTAYSYMGRGPEALGYFNQALPIWREIGERGGEALTLGNIAIVYANLGQKQRSLEYYEQALVAWREVGNRPGEARALNYEGRVYSDLGQKQKALELYNQALPIWRAVGNPNGEALALNDIGRVYADMEQHKKALGFFEQALPLWRTVGNRRGEAVTLTNIGRAWSGLGEQSKALEIEYQSLGAWREVEDRRGEAFALSSMGRAYSSLHAPGQALPIKLAALALAKAAGDPDLEGGIETSLMIDFRNQRRPEEAIFFGTEAVNAFQEIRSNIAGLDEELQAGFAQSKSETYRELAELLVQQDRLGEAEQVLDLLKEEELKEVVRGAANNPAAKVEPLPLSSAQQKAQSDLEAPEKDAAALIKVSVEVATLRAKAVRTGEEEARLKQLDAKIEAANGEVSSFFRETLYPELAKKAGTADANALVSKEKSDVSQLQNTLAELGPRVLGVRLLLGEERAYAIVVTANSREKVELKATPNEIASKVLEVRAELRSPASNPKARLEELYAMVVGPFAAELKALAAQPASAGQHRAPTVLWSLDGALRYVPMAALFDGKQYLVERFNNVLFTPESYGHMAAPVGEGASDMRVLAMGLSRSYGGLPALPGVMPELKAVVHDPAVPDSHGPMNGRLLPNDQFTLAALKTELGAGQSFPVVHIASHFVEETGGGTEPFLMLGGEDAGEAQGYALTLSKIEDSSISFHGTHLLTLSACSTAKGDAAKDGLEMDSLGMIAQQKDAEAVLATLWDVSDTSTSQLMSDFYARWVKDPADGKAEALRQAQLALLHSGAGGPESKAERGLAVVDETAEAQHVEGYAHPFYWAPFVLIGNFQ